MIECPYCEHEQNDPDDCYKDDVHYDNECNNCKKTYGFKIYYEPEYDSYKLPCANGEKHLWKKTMLYHKESYFYRCDYCNLEKIFKEPPV